MRVAILILACLLSLAVGVGIGRECFPVAPGGPDSSMTPIPAPTYVNVQGEKIAIAPGDTIEVESLIDRTHYSFGVARDSRGEADSGHARKIGNALSDKFSWMLPKLDIDEGTSAGGEVMYAAVGLASSGPSMIILAGILLTIGGVVASRWIGATGWYVAGGGVALIAIGLAFATYPWLAIVVPIVGIGLTVYLIFRARKNAATVAAKDTALQAVVTGVDSLKTTAAEAYQSVKNTVEAAAGPDAETVRTEVQAAKAAAGVFTTVPSTATGA